MPSEKQIEAAQKVFLDARPYMGSRELATLMLTAAEQAEPAPAARSGAAKVLQDEAEYYEQHDGQLDGIPFKHVAHICRVMLHRILAALDPAEPEVMCVGCEGKPSLGNSPCAVCGKQAAEPATDAEPVAWGEDIGGKIVSVRMDKSRHCTVPLYTRPPESRLREALEEIARSDYRDNMLDPNRNKRLAEAALAQEDGR